MPLHFFVYINRWHKIYLPNSYTHFFTSWKHVDRWSGIRQKPSESLEYNKKYGQRNHAAAAILLFHHIPEPGFITMSWNVSRTNYTYSIGLQPEDINLDIEIELDLLTGKPTSKLSIPKCFDAFNQASRYDVPIRVKNVCDCSTIKSCIIGFVTVKKCYGMSNHFSFSMCLQMATFLIICALVNSE